MDFKNRPTPSRKKWAYGYEISPPMTQARLTAIEQLLEEEHANAKLQTRTWQGRFVVEEQVTHLLVVSDSPDQEMDVNRKLEEELHRLEAKFSLTPPVELGDGDEPPLWSIGGTPDA